MFWSISQATFNSGKKLGQLYWKISIFVSLGTGKAKTIEKTMWVLFSGEPCTISPFFKYCPK
jgi:hypothetical protein